jgi:hypothetical protein
MSARAFATLLTALSGLGLVGVGPSILPVHAVENLPDLVPQRPSEVDVAYTTSTVDPLAIVPGSFGPPRLLRFTSAVWNRGSRPLDILGTPRTDPGAEPLSLAASQCVQWSVVHCAQRHAAGSLRWHGAHRHWHFEAFELYELRRLRADGLPDFSGAGLVGAGQKASFCLEDSESDDQALPTYQTCSGVLQGISPGWADVYGLSLPGQSLVIDDVPDGRYALVFTVDPDQRLVEADRRNNVAYSVVELFDHGTAARVLP